jgi:hypothetical protein
MPVHNLCSHLIHFDIENQDFPWLIEPVRQGTTNALLISTAFVVCRWEVDGLIRASLKEFRVLYVLSLVLWLQDYFTFLEHCSRTLSRHLRFPWSLEYLTLFYIFICWVLQHLSSLFLGGILAVFPFRFVQWLAEISLVRTDYYSYYFATTSAAGWWSNKPVGGQISNGEKLEVQVYPVSRKLRDEAND